MNERALDALRSWRDSLPKRRQYGDRPAKGVVAAALVVLERLRESADLDIKSHLAPGGAQIAGLNPGALRNVLERFGESRAFPSEAGRTNRGNVKPINNLLDALRAAGLERMAPSDRGQAIDAMQRELVSGLGAYYQLERIRVEIDDHWPVRHFIGRVLEAAAKRDQAGPVAQHLVGAKLALRFPNLDVPNAAHSAADRPTGRSGDFRIKSTAFHVTIAPGRGQIDRCVQNLRNGMLPFLLVPHGRLVHAQALVDSDEFGVDGRIAVESIESFVGQNLSELATFDAKLQLAEIGKLLREYNRRVREVETDFSLEIQIPAALEAR